jgi:hypothetical protein
VLHIPTLREIGERTTGLVATTAFAPGDDSVRELAQAGIGTPSSWNAQSFSLRIEKCQDEIAVVRYNIMSVNGVGRGIQIDISPGQTMSD